MAFTNSDKNTASFTDTDKSLITDAIPGVSTNTDATSPGTMADDATVGIVAWTDPDNAKVSDDVYATAILSSQQSHKLQAKNFGFSIPIDATITSILLEIESKTNNGNVTMRVVAGPLNSYANNQGTQTFTTTEQYVSWNLQLFSISEINGSDFGIELFTSSTNTDTISVDHIRITVYYTTADIPATLIWTDSDKNSISPTNSDKNSISATNSDKTAASFTNLDKT